MLAFQLQVLVSTLQHHFLRFSQRLHSAELERRTLRVEAANQKRGLVQAKDPTGEMVSTELLKCGPNIVNRILVQNTSN